MKRIDPLSQFPKKRPALPAPQQSVYEREYQINRSGQGLLYGGVRRLEQWMHRQVADPSATGPVLELGAGGLHHVEMEPLTERYDIVEPATHIAMGAANLGTSATISSATGTSLSTHSRTAPVNTRRCFR